MRNKKGLLLAEETLKIIIALIGIGFLVYFLAALYLANTESKELAQAKNSLERVDEIIRNLIEEGKEEQDISPEGWHLFSFTEDKKPNVCTGKNCLCICDNVFVDDTLFGLISDRQVNECSEEGACLIVENLNKFEEIKITDKLTKIEIKKEDNEISIKEIKEK